MEQLFINTSQTIRILKDDENKTLNIENTGNIKEEDYKEGFNILLQKLTEYGYMRVLVNQEHMTDISSKARAWLLSSYMPKVVEQFGYDIKIAALNSRAIVQKIGQKAFNNAFVKQTGNLQVKYFDTKEDAQKWLLQ